MIPDDFLKYIPKFLKDNIDTSGQALVTYINDFKDEFYDYIRDLYFFKDALRVPVAFLDELGYWLSADLKQTDSEQTKREKIYYAILNHKKRGSWENDAKIKIDSITGYDAVIFYKPPEESDDSIEMGQTADEDSSFYWSTESGYDGADAFLGTWEVGDFTEYVIAGNIYINCHDGVTTGVLTSDQIDQIVEELATDIVPAYFTIYLGYENASGQFIVYAGGTIS